MHKVLPFYLKTKNYIGEKISGFVSLKDSFIDGVIAFVLSLVSVFSSVAPFGVSFFAATFSESGWMLKMASVILGTFLSVGIASGVKYLFSMVIFTVITVMLSVKKPVYRALSLAGSVFLVNIIVFLTRDVLLYDFFIALCEGFLCFVSVMITNKAYPVMRRPSTAHSSTVNELICVACVLSLMLMPFGGVGEIFGVSVVNCLSLILCLSFAYKTDIGKSAAVGVVLGAINGVNEGNVSIMMGIYAFASMCASTFNSMGKITTVLGFILSASFVSVFVGGTVDFLIDIYEIILAALIFMITPGKVLAYFDFSDKYSNTKTWLVYSKLEGILTKKISELYRSLKFLKEKFITFNHADSIYTKKEIITLFDDCSSMVCANCGMKYNCWQNSYKKTYRSMFDMMEICESEGELTHSNLPYEFKKNCVKTDDFIYEFNTMYKNYKTEKLWRMKVMESKNIAVTQLECVAEVVNNICEEINVNVDTEAEEAIYSGLTKAGFSPFYVWVLVKNEEQFEIDISMSDLKKDDEKKICETVSNSIQKALRVAGVNESSKSKVITLLPRENYSVSVGVCQAVKDGEKVCGDSYTSVCMTEGGHFVAICDGMGSGEEAHNESVAVIELLKQLIEAGFTLDSALNLINSSIILRNRHEMFSTLDVCTFDLKTGAVSFKKAGGATSIICSNGMTEKISAHTLPVGIKISDGVGVFSRSLKDGGMVVMMSDGVADVEDDTDWIISICEERKRNNPQTIAKVIMDTAIKKSGGVCNDDMTVIVSKVISNV